ncbi:MAG TPA: hypothetical protein VFN87_13355 [Solirubrobacteraceae bacterium]|nr:hypothetical protein [Solirubrobacteraceae bacterium]
MSVLSYFDVIVLIVAAPIMILIGVPAAGYAVGAGAWIVLRLLGIGVERAATASPPQRAIGIRLGFMLGRLFALAIAVILVRNADGQNAGLACLAVVVFAFTVSLATSALTRPRRS